MYKTHCFLSLKQFCQPGGWELTERRQEPTFFVSVLTDIDGERHYCACLTFHEPYDDQRDSSDNLESLDNEMVPHSMMFAPKSIVLISQLDYFDTFKVWTTVYCSLTRYLFSLRGVGSLRASAVVFEVQVALKLSTRDNSTNVTYIYSTNALYAIVVPSN